MEWKLFSKNFLRFPGDYHIKSTDEMARPSGPSLKLAICRSSTLFCYSLSEWRATEAEEKVPQQGRQFEGCYDADIKQAI